MTFSRIPIDSSDDFCRFYEASDGKILGSAVQVIEALGGAVLEDDFFENPHRQLG